MAEQNRHDREAEGKAVKQDGRRPHDLSKERKEIVEGIRVHRHQRRSHEHGAHAGENEQRDIHPRKLLLRRILE